MNQATTPLAHPGALRRRIEVGAGLISFASAMLIVVLGNTGLKPGENGGTGPAIVSGLLCAAVALGLFGYALPRIKSTERAMVVLGTLSVLSLVAFWSGVTPLLAGAVMALRYGSSGRTRAATWTVPVSAGAALVAVGATIIGKL